MKEELLKRTFNSSKSTIYFINKLPRNTVNLTLRKQLLRSITSIGANYREALEAESKKDFIHKLAICKKEARESIYWLNLILENNPSIKKKLGPIIDESQQFVKIFASSIKKKKKNIL